jgi:hypothetical protein
MIAVLGGLADVERKARGSTAEVVLINRDVLKVTRVGTHQPHPVA